MEVKQVVKIRLKRFGAAKRPCYRVVVMDSREPRDGRCIEELGTYQPIAKDDSQITLNEDRVKYWIGVGAQPSDIVAKLMNKKGLAKNGQSK
ncbi:MAG: 30S ribosomal protein S16 [Treponema sp.]|nr:30S ribosomal protein S16 [Candidatus Treponema merdequi]MBQ0161742.1 30S ribosomal protein S16 [Candidatus Treponema scatequi]